MKHFITGAFFAFLCTTSLYGQQSTYEAQYYQTPYEKEVLMNSGSTHLEQLMAVGPAASAKRTESVKTELDAFVNEIKSSKLIKASETKLIKELHKKVHERFLKQYKLVSPFPDIFTSGQYNCVSATALFALVLEELHIPYDIQEIPAHVYLIAYPDTKAISVEMTARTDAYSMPARKQVNNALAVLLESGLTTKDEIMQDGPMVVYERFYNTNKIINLKELAGLQYYNNAIVASDAGLYEKAYNEICKSEKLYSEHKVGYLHTELLYNLLSEAKFDRMQDIAYLVDLGNIQKNKDSKVVSQYASFLNDNIILNSHKALADSSYTYIVSNVKDTSLLKRLSAFYYLGNSEYYSNKYNLKKKLEYAELAYINSPEIPGIQNWLAECVLQKIDKDMEDEEEDYNWWEIMEMYAKKYPYLLSHNLFMKEYFYACADASDSFYLDNDEENGKLYMNRALQIADTIEDKEAIEPESIAWMYAEAGSFLARKHRYEEALEVLNKGLEYDPEHEHILARIKIVKDRMKK